MTKTGRRNQTYWRIAVFDQRTRRDGRPIEYLGQYDPHKEKDEEKSSFNAERVKYWLSKGAQPTDTVASLLKKGGIEI